MRTLLALTNLAHLLRARGAFVALVCGLMLSLGAATPQLVYAGTKCGGGTVSSTQAAAKGETTTAPYVITNIDLGCQGKGNPIMDMIFGIVRFLSAGVGLVIVGSLIYAGIMYTSSRGDASATAKAVERLRSNVIALLVFLFAYALLNYVIPGAFLK